MVYYSEIYESGTACDVTKKPRSVEVRYLCASQGGKKMRGSFITSVSEPVSCHYVLEIQTSLLCDHPLFREKEDNVNDIVCYLEDRTKYTKGSQGGTSTTGAMDSSTEREQEAPDTLSQLIGDKQLEEERKKSNRKAVVNAFEIMNKDKSTEGDQKRLIEDILLGVLNNAVGEKGEDSSDSDGEEVTAGVTWQLRLEKVEGKSRKKEDSSEETGESTDAQITFQELLTRLQEKRKQKEKPDSGDRSQKDEL